MNLNFNILNLFLQPSEPSPTVVGENFDTVAAVPVVVAELLAVGHGGVRVQFDIFSGDAHGGVVGVGLCFF